MVLEVMIEPWRRRDATPSTPSTRCDNLIYAQVLGLCDLVLSEVHHLHRVNRAWWRWMRYVLVTIIIFTMLGSVASMYAFSYTIYFKWPDYYVEAHGRPNTWSPYGFGNWFVYVAVLPCVEINQCVGCTRKFFTKSFLGDDAAVLAPSSGEEPASPRHRADAASMASRTTR